MKTIETIYGNTTTEIFEKISSDFAADPGFLGYERILEQEGRNITLIIDIDPGGGFEGGFESTFLSATLLTTPPFHFAIHHEGLFDDIGKLFGMQDVETGYPEFDKKVVVKTNNEEKVKTLFSKAAVRTVFGNLQGFNLRTNHHHATGDVEKHTLEFNIDTALINATELRNVYEAFLDVLHRVDETSSTQQL